MGLLSDTTCAAWGIEEDSALQTLANLKTQIFSKTILSVSEYEGMSAGSIVQFAEKAVDLRLVFNATSNMGCTLGPISDPRAEVVYNFTHS
jgi:hypothetical protein